MKTMTKRQKIFIWQPQHIVTVVLKVYKDVHKIAITFLNMSLHVEWYLMKRKIVHVFTQNLKYYLRKRYKWWQSRANTWIHIVRHGMAIIRGQLIFARMGVSFVSYDGGGGSNLSQHGRGHLLDTAFEWGVMNFRAYPFHSKKVALFGTQMGKTEKTTKIECFWQKMLKYGVF